MRDKWNQVGACSQSCNNPSDLNIYGVNLKNIFKVASFLQMFSDDHLNNATEKDLLSLGQKNDF